jgi:hypothetical protein
MPYDAPFGLAVRDVRSSTPAPEDAHGTALLRSDCTFVIMLRYSGLGRASVKLWVENVHIGDFVIRFGTSVIDGAGGDSGRFCFVSEAVAAQASDALSGQIVAEYREEPARYRSRRVPPQSAGSVLLSTQNGAQYKDCGCALTDLGPRARLELQLRVIE